MMKRFIRVVSVSNQRTGLICETLADLSDWWRGPKDRIATLEEESEIAFTYCSVNELGGEEL